MDRVKQLAKYVIWGILLLIFSRVIIYIGLNIDYEPIKNYDNIPSQIKIIKAEATGVNGRIYGEISNSETYDVNGSYIKVNIYDKDYELSGTKYIEIVDVPYNTSKLFELHFQSNQIEYYNIDIVEEKDENTAKLFENIFISEDLKLRALCSLLIYACFFL